MFPFDDVIMEWVDGYVYGGVWIFLPLEIAHKMFIPTLRDVLLIEYKNLRALKFKS